MEKGYGRRRGGGLKISRTKARFNGTHINLQRDNLERLNTLKYLGATLTENGDMDAEMTHRTQSGWKHGKRVSGLCVTEE